MDIINSIFSWLATIMNWAINIKLIDNITVGHLTLGLFTLYIIYYSLMKFIDSRK
jgi:hypothetical protein